MGSMCSLDTPISALCIWFTLRPVIFSAGLYVLKEQFNPKWKIQSLSDHPDAGGKFRSPQNIPGAKHDRSIK